MKANIDYEIRSRVNLKKVGPRRYVEPGSDASVMCLGISVDEAEPYLWFPGDPFPRELYEADEIHAWNAAFERTVWEYLCRRLYGWGECPPPSVWVDTQARAALAGLPMDLGKASKAIGLPVDQQKDKEGKKLIQDLCSPKRNGEWNEDPEKLAKFYEYCKQDVRTEIHMGRGLPRISWREQQVWALTQDMNERGIPVDVPGAVGAIQYADRAVEELNVRAAAVSGGAFKKTSQLKKVLVWVAAQGVEGIDNMQAATLEKALLREDLPDDVRLVLTARSSAGLVSIKKFHAAALRACANGRVHDTQKYHGASTGRWSSIGLQVHNIKRPNITPIAAGRVLTTLADHGHLQGRSFLDGLTLLSNCVRAMIQAEPGHVLVASDYSQIELRVLLWLAQDEKNLQELRDGLDPYKTMAATIFSNTYENVTPDERQAGKSAVLGCGYQLGGKTFQVYAADRGTILTLDESFAVVDAFRQKYRKVKSFWYELQETAIEAIHRPGSTFRCRRLFVRARKDGKFLEIMLPSSRPIRYFRPRIEKTFKFNQWLDEVHFDGTDTYTKQWGDQSTYGGKLVENVTQGFARDVMAAGMGRADAAGLPPIMTVHDEVVCHVREGEFEDPLHTLNECLLKLPRWAQGLPLAAEGWAGTRYRK